jgi:hypothetical protein
MLRPEAIRERLLRLEEVLSHLEELRNEGLDPRGGFRRAWLVERGLPLATEIALDIGNHVLSAGLGVAARDEPGFTISAAAEQAHVIA